jgi:DNA polymerase III epsilon subunit family exonuclease
VTGDPYGAWYEHDFVVFDVETTGLERFDRIVEIGFARFEGGKLVKEWGSLLNPGVPIPPDATAIHGISDDDVADAPRFLEALPDAFAIAHDAHPVAYNASFDRGFWFRELGETPLTDLTGIPLCDERVRWLDPLIWMRKMNGPGQNKLTQCCKRHGIDIGNAHRATDDAVAAGKLMLIMEEENPPFTLCETLRRQTIIGNKQDATRRARFASQGRPYR